MEQVIIPKQRHAELLAYEMYAKIKGVDVTSMTIKEVIEVNK